jgi:hypothetical protein
VNHCLALEVSMRATASLVMVLAGLSAALSAQIPERAEWEITFAQVEAAAGLSNLRTGAPKTFEARLMERPWSAMGPVPFLRLVRIDGTVTAQLFVFWAPARMAPVQRPQGADMMCRDGVCVRPIDIKEQRIGQRWSRASRLRMLVRSRARILTLRGPVRTAITFG